VTIIRTWLNHQDVFESSLNGRVEGAGKAGWAIVGYWGGKMVLEVVSGRKNAKGKSKEIGYEASGMTVGPALRCKVSAKVL
jgi:hypothetical protein